MIKYSRTCGTDIDDPYQDPFILANDFFESSDLVQTKAKFEISLVGRPK